jgi:hypothetical protein
MRYNLLAYIAILAGCTHAPGAIAVRNESSVTLVNLSVALSDTFLRPTEVPSSSTRTTEVVHFDSLQPGNSAQAAYSRAGEYYITVTARLANNVVLTNTYGYAEGAGDHVITITEDAILVDGAGPAPDSPTD